MDARTLFKIVFVIGFVAAAVIRAAGVKGAKQTRRMPEDSRERALLLLNLVGMQVLPLIYLVTDWLDFADFTLAPLWGWIGAALFALGLVLLWRSHADLGRYWTVSPEIREEHRLVTQGVYRHIRHPMYTGHLLWALGQPLLLWNWLAGFGYLAATVALLVFRIPREEQMMIAHFGEDYRRYMARTGALLPRLSR
ncbi:MAG: isoprenylcysteine carboxylmethyltransferase family protein [Anaerolineae bacterium]|nr:isoprenylcysteine carboxylmethyltransferase family protein [Anaerolineae bacterium]